MEISSEIKEACSLDLLEYIGWKNEYQKEAELAFHEFCFRFEGEIKKRAEIACDKWNYNEVVALDIVKCTLAKVWKYPSYKHEKSNAKSVDVGIIIWIGKIIYTQLANYHNDGFCYKPDEESDLSLMYSIEDLSEFTTDSEESKRIIKKRLELIERALQGLTEKHRVIYLTYKLYEQNGKYIPRSVTKKLRDELSLAQGTIRKYKEEANKHVQLYLASQNG